jgi:hypothetical protein
MKTIAAATLAVLLSAGRALACNADDHTDYQLDGIEGARVQIIDTTFSDASTTFGITSGRRHEWDGL